MEIVAVTGGSGFIGEYVVEELVSQDFGVMVIDHHANWDILANYGEVDELLSECQAVIHLAGVLGTDELFDDVDLAIDVNVKGTAKILQSCARHQLSYVGITMPQCWHNIYQATKLAAGRIATAYHKNYEVPVCHTRAFNVYGEGQRPGIPQKLIPTFATLAWKKEPLPIWGEGSQLVDLVYVKDVAKVLVECLQWGDDRIIDAGTGFGLSVLNVADYINTYTGSDAGVVHFPMRRGEDGPGMISDHTGHRELGWYPKFNEDDLQRTLDSYKPL